MMIISLQSWIYCLLGFNPWEESTNLEEIGEALVQGMRHSTSIEYLDVHDAFSESFLTGYYCNLNHERRNIFSVSTPVPLGLWPHILKRGQKNIEHEADIIYFYYNTVQYRHCLEIKDCGIPHDGIR